MKKACLLLMFAFYLSHNQAQTLAKNDPLKLDADFYLMEKDFQKALNLYQSILRSEPDNADIKFKAGVCYLNSENEKEKAIPLLEEASLKISEKYKESSFKETNAPIDVLFLLGSAYRVNNQLDEAIEAYRKYRNYLSPNDDYNLNVVDQYIRNCEFAKDLQKKPINLTTQNLGPVVNSAAPNFNAVLSGDGTIMFFTSPGRQGYDIYMTTMTDSVWGTPRNVSSVLGTGKYMMTSDLSYDGQTLILVLDDPMNSDLYVSRFAKGKWTKAVPIGKEINTKYNETHGSLSADGRILYFTSNRKGGVGDLDIYRSTLNTNGEWEKPENLGNVINTPFNEETPFLSEYGDVLYFSSEGHEGMGGYDIFYYNFSNTAEGVKNAGYPLSTTDNDIFYVPVDDGTKGYYSFAGEDSYGGRDIYFVSFTPKVEIPEVAEEIVSAPVAEMPVAEETVFQDTLMAVAPVEETMPAESPVQEEVIIEPVAEIPQETESPAAAVPDPEPVVALVAEAEVPSYNLPVRTETSLDYARVFRVQIMALHKPVDLQAFKDVTGVMLMHKDDEWYRYFVGNTTNRQEAQQILTDVVAKGYHDAFIRGSASEARFTIQVMAVPGPVVDLSIFSKLPDIMVTKGPDNFCRYTTGEFLTREEAQEQLSSIKALGFEGAFVTDVK